MLFVTVKNDFDFLFLGNVSAERTHVHHMSNVAQRSSMKVYKVCSVLDVRLLFLSDWSFKSKCECDLWRPPLPETIGLPTGRVLCILVIVKNYGILGDFGLN